MGRNRKPRAKTNARMENSLSEMSLQLSALNGSGNPLSTYGTIATSNNYSLVTLNRIILTYWYTGNGIFQTAIQLPIQDAIGKGIEIESGELDNDDIEKVYEYWEENGIWETILNYWTWVRLFGGGALLVNSNQNPEDPLNYNGLDKTPLEFYDLDRWQLDTNIAILDDWDSYISSGDSNGLIYLYGEPIHESRFLRGKGKRAPHYVRRQLRGWGMSEGERMIREINLYLKTQNVSYELLDEAKVDIYKIQNLASKMMQAGGTAKITQRVQAANEIKNYVNALVLDTNEEYEQKQMTFGGLADVMRENRMGVAAALRMPMTKLFGLSASGFNTGESDLENYNAMVESEIRAPLKPVIRKLLKITMAHLFGYVPTFSFNYPSLREMTPEVEQNVKTQETQRLLSIYDHGLMDSEETMQSLKKAGVVQIETKAEKGLLPPQPAPPTSADSVSFGGVGGSGDAERARKTTVSKSAYDPTKLNSLTFSGHKLQGRDTFQGMNISIENKKGSIREGVDVDGNPWKTEFKYPYGYIRGTVGVDKDHVDCYIGPNKEAENAFIIHQNVPETGKYDEDKIMLGFDSKEEAQRVYEEHYNKDGFFGGMKVVSVEKLKKLLQKKKGKKL